MSTYRFERQLPSELNPSTEAAELTGNGGGLSHLAASCPATRAQPRGVSLPFQDTQFELLGVCSELNAAAVVNRHKQMSAFKAVLAGIAIGLALPLSVLGLALFFCFTGPSIEKLGLVNPFGCAPAANSVIGSSGTEGLQSVWSAGICEKISMPLSASLVYNGPIPLMR